MSLPPEKPQSEFLTGAFLYRDFEFGFELGFEIFESSKSGSKNGRSLTSPLPVYFLSLVG